MTFDVTTAPVFVLLLAVLVIVVLRVLRAVQSGTFDATLLPQFLDGYVLGNIAPVAGLGVVFMAFQQAYPEPRDIVQMVGWVIIGGAYVVGVVAASIAYVVRITELVSGQPRGFDVVIDDPTEGPDKE